MARPREFDQDEAIDGAINVFWKQGYGSTNLPDLLNAMELSRGSFYAAFTDKHLAYIAALDRYENVYLAKLLADLKAQDQSIPLAERLLYLFNQIDNSGPVESRLGCFICNAMVEFGTTNPEIAEAAARMSGAIASTLQEMLEDAGKTTETAAAQAQALLQLYYGAQALSKAGNNLSGYLVTIKAIVD